jgi:hypothetical protein
MPFEYFVRPFQSADSHGRVILPSTPSGFERATLTWGAKVAGLPEPERTGPNVNCCGEQLDEHQRLGEVHKIVSTESPGLFILEHRAAEVRLKKKKQDKCAGDWTQMSYVASAVESAFAGLEADIEAGGAGADVDHCKTMVMHLNTEFK